MSDFGQAIAYVLQNEGGFVNNPNDPGGMTNFGITQNLLNSVMPNQAVQNLTQEIAMQVYEQVFWTPLQLAQLDQMKATCLLDAAVNCGPKLAITCAQLASGFVVTDGVMGPKTINAINGTDPERWLHDFMVHLKDHYCGICVQNPRQIVFLTGWMDRVIRMVLLLPTA
jgi:lysozyme family protein